MIEARAFRPGPAGQSGVCRDHRQAGGERGGCLVGFGSQRARLDSGQVQAISGAHKTRYGTYFDYFDRLRATTSAGDLLRALDQRGWRIVLVTPAAGFELNASRCAIDADDVIAHRATAADVSAGKPAPDQVRYACELAGVRAQQAVLVGDSVWDMEAAARAGSLAVDLLSGGISRGGPPPPRGGQPDLREHGRPVGQLDRSAFADRHHLTPAHRRHRPSPHPQAQRTASRNSSMSTTASPAGISMAISSP